MDSSIAALPIFFLFSSVSSAKIFRKIFINTVEKAFYKMSVSSENRIVIYIDRSLENAHLTLNGVSDVPASGLITGPSRAVVGGGQVITAIGVSVIRYVNRRPQTEDRAERDYATWDGLERASRGVANIAAGAIEFIRAGMSFLNPVALIYAIGEYRERQDRPNRH